MGDIPISIILRSLRNIGRKKFRTSLVLVFLSLIIGLLVIMVQVSVTSSQKYAELETRIQNTIEIRPVDSLGVGGVRVKPFPFESTMESIKGIPHISKVERYLIKRIFHEEESFEIIIGLDPESSLRVVGEPEPIDTTILAGRRLNESDRDQAVAVMGKALVEKKGIFPDDVGRATVQFNGMKFTVIGIFASGNDFTDHQAFIPFNIMRRLYNPKGVSKFFITVDNIQNTNKVIQDLKIRIKEADIIANEASIEFVKSSLQVIGSTTLYSSFFFFIVGALLIIFVMMLVFRERQREVGILKALGASRSDIAKQFVVESIFLTLLGGVGGLGVSAVGLYFFSLTWTNISFQLVTTPLPLLTVLEMILASVALGTAGSVYPIIRSWRLSPVETLRVE
ncbi:MAG: FtsX-like permease family protein [Syntrophobacteria bacterium]|jgi:putative ABC transport system permease protein